MTKEQIKNKINQIMSDQSTGALKESLIKLMNDFRDGSDIAFDSVLNELEKRLPEIEFIKLCEAI
jgi:hypothetical protein